MSPGSVGIEIFSVRLPPEDAGAAGKIWDEVDEQHLSPDLRQRLSRNGFRVGVLGGRIPTALARLMELKTKATTTMGEAQQVNLAALDAAPRVTSRHLQTRSGQRNEIVASGIYDHLPVLASESGELRGLTYSQAQGIFALSATPQSDGRVKLDLLPELHHDQSRQHIVGDPGMFRFEMGRPKRAFDEMKITAMLTPGSMLVLGSQPNRAGSLGHYFFQEGNGRDDRLEQKLILIRLCQTQHDDLIAPPSGLNLQ